MEQSTGDKASLKETQEEPRSKKFGLVGYEGLESSDTAHANICIER